jgi:hypothetical protein
VSSSEVVVTGFASRQNERVLLADIRAIADMRLSLAPHDLNAEFGNTRWFGATPDERSALSVEQVVSAFREAARAVQRAIGAEGVGRPATFYVWHDEQAGQLRCSVSSRTADALPFGGEYRPTDDLSAIVAAFLSDRAPGFVGWEEFEPGGEPGPEEIRYPPFPVWTFDLADQHGASDAARR